MHMRIATKSDPEDESLAKAESGKPGVFIKGEGVMKKNGKPDVECFYYGVAINSFTDSRKNASRTAEKSKI